ncbi:MAG: DUF5677 domain-containing protein [Patescibacteria group bacterium]|jgi:hypothetical protein
MKDLKSIQNLLSDVEELFEKDFKNQTDGKLSNNLTDQVILGLLVKSSKTIRAIKLISYGFGEDCIVLARTIFENYLNVKYILDEDEENRSKLFIYHGFYDGFKKIDNGLLNGIEKKSLEEIYTPEVREETAKIRDREYRCLKEKGMKTKKESWSLRSMKDMAEEIGETESYEKIYWVMSLYTHPSANSLRDYVQSKGKNLTFLDVPSANNIEEGLIVAIDFFLKLLKMLCERFGIEIMNKLSNARDGLERIISEEKKDE